MRGRRFLLLAAVAIAAGTSVSHFAPAGAAPGDNITICHANNSATNAYTSNTVDESAIDGVGGNDHFGHTGPLATSQAVAEALKDQKIQWGDIIPPLAGVHSGLNWPAGEAILENDCEFVQAVGSLQVNKVVDGTAPGGTTFTVSVDCDGTDFDETLTFNASGALTAGTNPQTGIPAGTECEVTETGTGGANVVSYNPGGASAPTVTILGGATSTVTVTNTFIVVPPGTGALLVTKSLDGAVNPPSGATFSVDVNCSDNAFDETLTFDDTGALTAGTNPQTGIALTTTCTVTETDDGGADDVSYAPGGANPPTVTITTPGNTVTVTVTNTFDEAPNEPKVFICHRTNATNNPYNKIEVAQSAVDGVGNGDHFLEHTGPIATSEAVAEALKDAKIEWGDIIPPLVGFHSGLNWPAGEAMFLNGDCEFVQAVGSLQVNKVVDGTAPGGTTFTVSVDCDGTDFDETLTFNASGALTAGTNPQTGIPAGTECEVTETGTGGANVVSYNPGGASAPTVTILGGATSTVTVTNTFIVVPPGTGALLVTKSLDGAVNPPSGATFSVDVNCSDNAFDETLTFDDTGALTAGTNPQTGIALTTTCTVTETDDGGADDVSYAPGGANPPTVTITTPGNTVTVTVTNTFDEAPNEPKVFICHRTNATNNPYNKIEVAQSAVDGVGNGDHFLEHTGPIATSEAVAEALKDAKIEWGDIIPPLVGFHSGLNWPAGEAMFLNGDCEFVQAVGSLQVNKVVDGTAPGGTTFTVSVDCDGTDFDETLTFNASGALTAGTNPQTGIPAGTECEVTETGTGGANVVSYNPGGASAPTVTILGGATSTVTVTNTFIVVPPGTGALLVTKSLDGAVNPPSGATFSVDVNCSDNAFDETLTFDDTGALTAGTNPQTGIALTTTCTVTETDDGGADDVSYAPGGANPPTVTITTPGNTVTVTVTNTFDAPPEPPAPPKPPVKPDPPAPPKPPAPPAPPAPPKPPAPLPPVVVKPPPLLPVTITNPVVRETLAFTGSSWSARLLKTGGLVLVIGGLMLGFGRRRTPLQLAAVEARPEISRPLPRPNADSSGQRLKSEHFQRAIESVVAALDDMDVSLKEMWNARGSRATDD